MNIFSCSTAIHNYAVCDVLLVDQEDSPSSAGARNGDVMRVSGNGTDTVNRSSKGGYVRA